MNVGLGYRIIRWPFVFGIGFIIICELMMYIFVRSFVVAYEYSRRGLKDLRDKIIKAQTFEEWRTYATEMDRQQKKDVWRISNDELPPLYDVPLISSTHFNTYSDQLKKYSSDLPEDPKARYLQLSKLAVTLEVACKNNLGGIENEHLYSRTYLGTKKLIEDFIYQVQQSLTVMFDSDFPIKEKRRLFKSLCKDYGKTALCLSGGATFGFYHLGVIKTLIELNACPKIVAGTSAGALIAALICVRTDDELKEILNPSLHVHLKSSDDTALDTTLRFIKQGVLYDAKQWIKKIEWITNGNTTFLEAYHRTGKILNISAVPTERHSPPKLLNYLNAPNVVIWSAVIASAAVPGLIEAPELWYKDENGQIQPWHSIGKKWRDGSLKTDIPISTLSGQFNVKYTVVSQVNPHVVPFFFNKRGSSGNPSLHRQGQGWRGGFVLSSLEHFLKLDLTKWLRLLRDLDLLPAVLGQDWSYVFLQKFEGNVTILPRVIVRDYFRLITDPDEKELTRYLIGGQRGTWPKISMIINRMKIEQFLFECKAKLAPPRRDSL